MRDAKVKSFIPITMPMSDDESKKLGPMKDKTSMNVSSAPTSTISPMPIRKAVVCGKLIPAPERLTPTGKGRIKAPPVCVAPSLKNSASSISDFNTLGVCFSPKEAELCAEKALVMCGLLDNSDCAGDDVEEPLNIDKCLGFFSEKSLESMAGIATAPQSITEGIMDEFVSSSSSIVSTSSCGRIAIGDETTAVTTSTSVDEMKFPPFETMSANMAITSEKEDLFDFRGAVDQTSAKTAEASLREPSLITFTNNLIKGNTSRQGRSLQRWLVHSPTNELVRQVAGTIPITKDGRIILISSSRKNEWILPKGGWDADETKEECAMRETFEEGGLVGQLGGCLEPIDYESAKSKKRALKESGRGGDIDLDIKACGEIERGSSQGQEESRPPLPPCPKRVKIELSSSPTGPELTFSSVKRANSSDSTSSSRSSDVSCTKETSCSYIRLNLFPLYVSSVKSEWPEKGRLRKLVHIDEAIRIMDAENRPYFRMGLKLVKERGLHLLMKFDQSEA